MSDDDDGGNSLFKRVKELESQLKAHQAANKLNSIAFRKLEAQLLALKGVVGMDKKLFNVVSVEEKVKKLSEQLLAGSARQTEFLRKHSIQVEEDGNIFHKYTWELNKEQLATLDSKIGMHINAHVTNITSLGKHVNKSNNLIEDWINRNEGVLRQLISMDIKWLKSGLGDIDDPKLINEIERHIKKKEKLLSELDALKGKSAIPLEVDTRVSQSTKRVITDPNINAVMPRQGSFHCKYELYDDKCTYLTEDGSCSLIDYNCWLSDLEGWFDDFIDDVNDGKDTLTKGQLLKCIIGAIEGVQIELKKEAKSPQTLISEEEYEKMLNQEEGLWKAKYMEIYKNMKELRAYYIKDTKTLEALEIDTITKQHVKKSHESRITLLNQIIKEMEEATPYANGQQKKPPTLTCKNNIACEDCNNNKDYFLIKEETGELFLNNLVNATVGLKKPPTPSEGIYKLTPRPPCKICEGDDPNLIILVDGICENCQKAMRYANALVVARLSIIVLNRPEHPIQYESLMKDLKVYLKKLSEGLEK